MNIASGSGRPSRNSQGIHNALQQPLYAYNSIARNASEPAIIPSTPVNSPLARSILPDSSSNAATVTPNSNSPVVILTG